MKNLVGKKYGRLTVIEFDRVEKRVSSTGKSYKYSYYWRCKCECGNYCIRNAGWLKETSSCGCLQKELLKNNTELVRKVNKGNSNAKKHGDTNTRFYNIYHGAKRRCDNPNDAKYSKYGARGIKFMWSSYEEFKADMYQSYLDHCEIYGEKNTTIDRIDVNNHYCKENCRWATIKEQATNTTRTIYVEMEDDTLCPLTIFSEKFNINYKTLLYRYRHSEYYGTHKIPYKELIKDKDIV